MTTVLNRNVAVDVSQDFDSQQSRARETVLSGRWFIWYEDKLVQSRLSNEYTQAGSALGSLIFTPDEQATIQSMLENPPSANPLLIDAFRRRIQ